MDRVLREVAALRMTELSRFIDAFREQGRQRRGSGPAQFDLLSVFKVALDETQHSAFLAWLLNAEASHNQGDLFLRAFLNACRPESHSPLPDAYHVQTEYWGGTSSIDVVVYQPRQFLMYVENKTGSGDTPGQLGREFRDMRRLGRAFDIPVDRQLAVYLTPEGRGPRPGEDHAGEWHTVSYGDLAGRLEELLPGIEDSRLRATLEAWLDAMSSFTYIARQTMKGFSEESVLIVKNLDTVVKIVDALGRLAGELRGILQATEADVKKLSWWKAGWRSHDDGEIGFYISNQNWTQDDGEAIVWLGVYNFDVDSIFDLGAPPNVYVGFSDGYEDLKRTLLKRWNSRNEADIECDEDDTYPIVQNLPKCLEEESAIRAYPEVVRQQMLAFFTRYATRLVEAGNLIQEYVPGGKKQKPRAGKH
jgi:hypothetical protein